MADIDILVNSSQVKAAKQELQELGNSFNSASKSASVFMQAFERAAKQSQRDEQYIRQTSQALQRLINDNLKITNAYKSAEQSASAFTEGLRKQETQALKTARANQSAVNKQLGVGGPSATSSGAGFGAIESQIERLRTKYDQIYASSQLYERSLKELDQAHMLGVLSAKKHEAAVEALNLEYQNFQSGIAQAGNRFTQHVNQTSTGMNKFGVAAQQTGYQFSDFIVQVQGGTNPLVAFSQQATQLAGLLYLLPPALQNARIGIAAFSVSLSTAFAGITILIPLLSMLAMSFFSSGKDAKSGSDGISTFSGALQRLTAEIEANQEAFLKAKFDTESSGVAGASQQIEDLRKQIPLVRAELDAFYMAVAQSGGISLGALFGDEGDALQEQLDNLEKQLFTLEAQAEAQRMLNGHMSVSALFAKTFTENLIRQRAEAERVKQAHADQVAYMGKTRQESDNFVASLTSAYIQLGNSKRVAAGLADEMTRAASASFALAQQNIAASGLTYSGRGGNPATVNQKGGAFVYEGPPLDANNNPIISGAPTESALEKFQKQLDLEKELLNTTESYQKVRSALGEEFVTTNPKVIEGLMQQAEEIENLTRVEEERKSLMDSVNSSLESGFMDMVKGTKTVGEAFRSMAAAIIEELFRVLVVQKLVGGITSAFGGGGFTNAQAARLTGGGRASGGSIMSGQAYMVGERGPELVIPRHSGTVVNANQTSGVAAGFGGFTQNLSINVTGSDAAMVRQEVAKMIPQITSATKAAVIDAKQRGGQMAAAFR